MSRARYRTFYLVKNGQIQGTVSLLPEATPHLPPGVTLVSQAAAIIQGLTPPSDVDTSRAQAAIVADFLASKRSSNITDNASTVAGGTGTPTLAQLTATVRLLAGWISVLASHDVLVQRELIALILRDLTDFGGIAAPPTPAVSITPTPAEATASGVPLAS